MALASEGRGTVAPPGARSGQGVQSPRQCAWCAQRGCSGTGKTGASAAAEGTVPLVWRGHTTTS